MGKENSDSGDDTNSTMTADSHPDHEEIIEISQLPTAGTSCGVSTQQLMQENKVDIVYSVLDVPPLPTTIMLSIQQFLTISCSIIPVPFVICPALCMAGNNPGRAAILSTMYFVSGMMTIIQIIFGVRLPIVQGMSASFLTPILSIMSLPQFQCPTTDAVNNSSSNNSTVRSSIDDPEIWHYRLRELQGSIAVVSVMQILLSATGLLSVILPFITPLVVIPTLTMIGLSVIQAVEELSSGNWAVSLCQHLENVPVPYPTYQRGKGLTIDWITWFKFFPVNCMYLVTLIAKWPKSNFDYFEIITSLIIMWVICYLLTEYNVLPEGNSARTDTVAEIIPNTTWFRFPYPGQWGAPTTSIPSAVGMLSSALAVVIESIGDYFACARLTDVPPPPTHAINRGVFIEGIGCLMAGLFGTGSGTTAYAESIGAISITKVGSRIVILVAAVYMLVFGVMTKFTAVIVSMPKPIMGGLMTVSFSLIAGIGISTAQYINLNSSRNIFVLGFSIWFGLSMPAWVSKHKDFIKTGSFIADEAISILLSTSMFVGGVSGFILDNTIPGSAADRGLTKWMKSDSESNANKRADVTLYDLPFGMDFIRKIKAFRYFPLCPTFRQKVLTPSPTIDLRLSEDLNKSTS